MNEIKSQPQTKILICGVMREISFLKPPKNIHTFNSSTPHIKSLSKKEDALE